MTTHKNTTTTTTNHHANKETTMTTTKKAQSTNTRIPAQLQAIETACGYGDPLPDATRDTSEALIRRVPTTIVDRIIALAARGGGEVAGITFDPTAAKAALTAADAVAAAAQMLARRAEDQAIRLRANVVGDASAIRTAMIGYAKTAQGASLRQENDEIRSLAKQHRAVAKARKTRAEKSVTVSPPPTTPTEPPAHGEPLATAATVTPAASH
jgi:hypothetical protein